MSSLTVVVIAYQLETIGGQNVSHMLSQMILVHTIGGFDIFTGNHKINRLVSRVNFFDVLTWLLDFQVSISLLDFRLLDFRSVWSVCSRCARQGGALPIPSRTAKPRFERCLPQTCGRQGGVTKSEAFI